MTPLRTREVIQGRTIDLLVGNSFLRLWPIGKTKTPSRSVIAIGPLKPIVGERSFGGIVEGPAYFLSPEFPCRPAEAALPIESIAMLKQLTLTIDSHFDIRGEVVAADHLAFTPEETMDYRGHDARESMNSAAGGILTLGLFVDWRDKHVPFALPLLLNTDSRSQLAPSSIDTMVRFSLTTSVKDIADKVFGHFANWSGPMHSSKKSSDNGLSIFSLELSLFNKATGRGVQTVIPSGELIKQTMFYSR